LIGVPEYHILLRGAIANIIEPLKVDQAAIENRCHHLIVLQKETVLFAITMKARIFTNELYVIIFILTLKENGRTNRLKVKVVFSYRKKLT
jgi:hypothetical protein